MYIHICVCVYIYVYMYISTVPCEKVSLKWQRTGTSARVANTRRQSIRCAIRLERTPLGLPCVHSGTSYEYEKAAPRQRHGCTYTQCHFTTEYANANSPTQASRKRATVPVSVRITKERCEICSRCLVAPRCGLTSRLLCPAALQCSWSRCLRLLVIPTCNSTLRLQLAV